MAFHGLLFLLSSLSMEDLSSLGLSFADFCLKFSKINGLISNGELMTTLSFSRNFL